MLASGHSEGAGAGLGSSSAGLASTSAGLASSSAGLGNSGALLGMIEAGVGSSGGSLSGVATGGAAKNSRRDGERAAISGSATSISTWSSFGRSDLGDDEAGRGATETGGSE